MSLQIASSYSPLASSRVIAPSLKAEAPPAPAPAPTDTSDFLGGVEYTAGKVTRGGSALLGAVLGGGATALVALPALGIASVFSPGAGVALAGVGLLAVGVVGGGYIGHKVGCLIDRGAGNLGNQIATSNDADPQASRAIAKTVAAALVTAPLGLTPLALIAIGIGGLIGAGQHGGPSTQPSQPPSTQPSQPPQAK